MNRIDLLKKLSDIPYINRLDLLSGYSDISNNRIHYLINITHNENKRLSTLMKVTETPKIRSRIQAFKNIFNLDVFNRKRLGSDDE